jgi:hypothetical protein
MNPFKQQQLWNDPTHWVFGVLYRAPSDPRWVVPMRFTNAAWTPNIAHTQAVLVATGIVAAASAPAVTAALLGRLGEPGVAIGALAWFVLCLLPVGVAARHRHD